MKEKYESLAANVLRDLAKARGIPGISKLKKDELVEVMLKQDEADAANAAAKEKAEQKLANEPKKQDRPPKRKPQPDKSGSEGKQSDNAQQSEGKQHNDRPQGERSQGDRSSNERTQGDNKNQPEKSGAEQPAAPQPPAEDVKEANGILEVMSDGFVFIRCENFLPGENDVYVAPAQIRKFNLKTGDIITGKSRKNKPDDKFGALLHIDNINGFSPDIVARRPSFEKLTPIFPDERIRLEHPGCSVAMRIVDLLSPIGKGQRGMIVSQPKAGKTTLLKQIAKSVKNSYPDMHIIILLIDERPEEVTDMKETVEGNNVEVIYSTFDELPENHKRVSEMVIERAKRLVEHGQDVMILLDSITRLARAYNLTVSPSGRTLSGGLDPAALHMPKRFFGAARNMREGGSLTILATALVETGSKMDDVVFEEFKGTGNMELVLDRKLSEKRVFPAIDLARSSTRREDLLFTHEELEASDIIRKGLNGLRNEEAAENILNMFTHTKSNREFIENLLRKRMLG